jgi:hypothetical protein
MPITISLSDTQIDSGNAIQVSLGGDIGGKPPESVEWAVLDPEGNEVGEWVARDESSTVWSARRGAEEIPPHVYVVRARATAGKRTEEATERLFVRTRSSRGHRPIRIDGPVRVDLERHDVPDTPDLALWEVIRLSAEAVSFDNYAAWMDYLFCDGPLPDSLPTGDDLPGRWRAGRQLLQNLERAPLRFPEIEAYRVLKAATEVFLEFHCGVVFKNPPFPTMRSLSPSDRERLGLERGDTLKSLWDKYLIHIHAENRAFIPYLYRVRQKLRDVDLTTDEDRLEGEFCDKILQEKFTAPCLLELIWSYWHEEGMLVQTLNAISMRFQNRRKPGGVDPLVNLTLDPLRPLSNLLWGYIQDEQHRLMVAHRASEYRNEYGMTLLGEAVPQLRDVENRAGFLEAFHNLLHCASIFYKEDDDTTVIADAFPVLNALREVHLLLAESGNNQWRGLTWTARGEMLLQQWLLARSEFREFLPSRPMVVYPEPWMDRVDAMKKLQGWTDTSVRFFHDLAVFGEQILLSIRYGDWSNVTDRHQAGNWARAFREEVVTYGHAYRSVTGVDLSADIADVRQAEQARARALPPAYHLQRRLTEQRRAIGAAVRQPIGQPTGRP